MYEYVSGTSWQRISPPGGLGTAVWDLEWVDGHLWAAGADGFSAAVHRWDGVQWESMGNPGGVGIATSVTTIDGEVYVTMRDTGLHRHLGGALWQHLGSFILAEQGWVSDVHQGREMVFMGEGFADNFWVHDPDTTLPCGSTCPPTTGSVCAAGCHPGSCIYTFSDFDDGSGPALFAGAYAGQLYRWSSSTRTFDDLGSALAGHVQALAAFQGRLWLGDSRGTLSSAVVGLPHAFHTEQAFGVSLPISEMLADESDGLLWIGHGGVPFGAAQLFGTSMVRTWDGSTFEDRAIPGQFGDGVLALLAVETGGAPVTCDPGSPAPVECQGISTAVMLDGSASSPSGALFTWTGPFIEGVATGETPTVHFAAPGEYTVSLLVESGSESERCETTVIVADTLPPTLHDVPGDLVISCDAPLPSFGVTASDQCDQDPVLDVQQVTVPGRCPFNYQVQSTWTATDAEGHQTEAMQVTTVDDTTPPVLTAGTIAACYPAQADAEAAAITATTGLDNCSSLIRSTLVATTTGTCAATISVAGQDDCGNVSLPVAYTTRIDGSGPDVTAVLTPADPAGPVSAVSACSPTSGPVAFIVGGSATDDCDVGPLDVEATLHVTNTVVDDLGNCSRATEVFEVAIGERIVLQLAAPACASSPQSAKVSNAVNSDGIRTFCGESIVLQVTAVDGCGQAGSATFDPSVDTTADCERVLPDGSCCPALVPQDACESPCPSGPAKVSFERLSSASSSEKAGLRRERRRRLR